MPDETIVEYKQWRVACDAAATHEVATRLEPGPLVCACVFCRNFVAAGERGLPEEFVELLRRLGLRPSWARDVYDLGPSPRGGRMAGGWYHLVGRVVAGKSKRGADSVEAAECFPFHVDFGTTPRAVAEAFGRLSVVQMDFVVPVPWVQDEPEPQGEAAERAAGEHRPPQEMVEAGPGRRAAPASLTGRFVVEFKNQRHTGMAAEEIIAALEQDPNWNPLAIYQIRFVYDDGRMELIGVEDTDFAREGCILLHRGEVKEVRARYEALLARARQTPPPCRIALQMSKPPGGDGRYAIAMLFPAICQDGVEYWARQAGVEHAAIAAAGPAARQRYDESHPDVVIEDVMESRVEG